MVQNWRIKIQLSKSNHTPITLKQNNLLEITLNIIPISQENTVKYLGFTLTF